MSRRNRQLQRRRKPVAPVAAAEQQLAACRAAALGLLLAGLTDDGRVGVETDRILRAGENVAGAVLGFMTEHSAADFIRQHGSRHAAINAVTLELTTMIAIAEQS